MVELLKPKRGGFLRPFGCGQFIREFLLGYGPYESPVIQPDIGAPQADIFLYYKNALIRETAIDWATRDEERQARRQKRRIEPDNIEKLTQKYITHLPYKAHGCRYHSFVVYFSNLKRLHWVEPTGREEISALQQYYAAGQPRRYYRITDTGSNASEREWHNPYLALYR